MCCPQHSCHLYTGKFLLLGVIGPNTKPSVSLFWPHFVVAYLRSLGDDQTDKKHVLS